VELIPAAAANGAISQGAERVAFGVDLAGLVRGIGRMKEAAVFRRKQEDEAIDKAKQLIEELRHRQPATGEPVAEIGVRGIREKSVAEREQCFLDANAEALTRCEALFAAGFAPAFESTVGDRAAWLTEAAGVNDEPERCKAGEVLVFEDLPQVGFQKGRAGKALVVAEKTEALAVAAESPEGVVLGIEPFLQRRCGGAATIMRQVGAGVV
jgi:hypothetical protein